ncbi:rod shape-determining protein MreD [Paenibacillus polymyxa]|uniref:rod shape-determining protein MreD n=1 Tax=Paenibacillus jamilae TaxID=114136 RepID=UPI0007ABD9C1|nr:MULTISPECIES: rod shape-determining protein MreD [Paenibacillus]KZE67631.1 rod shape-determining protein MreD [Paenibacillus jamilae]NEU28674.1 rod shape-determining protein MreD [Paenibacillus polymyxa]OBA02957.1 rod shape-determining protein MreD [Paenibacillus polymyxa]QDY83791.1 rod shape-determining protein MreD [Paenibacillus polymyxa]
MKMRGQVLILLLFVLFIAEGTILPWLLPDSWHPRMVPNFVYVVILFVSVYYSRHTALVLGIVFGLIHDVVYYGFIIGPYSFAMGLSAYLLGLVFTARRAPMPIMMAAVLIGSFLLDSMLFAIDQLFQLNHQTFNWALAQYMIPDLFIHFLFALIIYVPVRKQLQRLGTRVKKEEAV